MTIMSRRRDRFSKAKRSQIMSKIRSRNTSLDLAMKKILREEGIKFKMYPKIFGNPDFKIEKKIVIFCDSSFWHGRNWKKLKLQLGKGSNSTYWIAHIDENRRRDRLVNTMLRKDGYIVLRFWDDEILKMPQKCIDRIMKVIQTD